MNIQSAPKKKVMEKILRNSKKFFEGVFSLYYAPIIRIKIRLLDYVEKKYKVLKFLEIKKDKNSFS